MSTLRIELEDDLNLAIDFAAKGMGISRSEFVRTALMRAIKEAALQEELVERHRRGYEEFPVQRGEFIVEE